MSDKTMEELTAENSKLKAQIKAMKIGTLAKESLAHIDQSDSIPNRHKTFIKKAVKEYAK